MTDLTAVIWKPTKVFCFLYFVFHYFLLHVYIHVNCPVLQCRLLLWRERYLHLSTLGAGRPIKCNRLMLLLYSLQTLSKIPSAILKLSGTDRKGTND